MYIVYYIENVKCKLCKLKKHKSYDDVQRQKPVSSKEAKVDGSQSEESYLSFKKP